MKNLQLSDDGETIEKMTSIKSNRHFTVKELIRLLSTYNENLLVYHEGCGCCYAQANGVFQSDEKSVIISGIKD